MQLKVFLPQDIVDAWVTSDKVDLNGETMTFRSNGLSLRLVPGYFFDHVSAGTDAGNDLLGKVKAKAAMAALGAEAYMNSIIVGETAYDVELGYVAKTMDANCSREALVRAMEEAGY
jgi:hypothetical protein